MLILDPQLPAKHMPEFDFAKYQGRGDDYVDSDNECEQLVIMPKDELTRKKTVGLVGFDKLTGRPVDKIELDEDEPLTFEN